MNNGVNVLKLLGNPYRLQIAFLLAKGGQTNLQMVNELDMSLQSFTHHLTRFRNQGYISTKRVGRNVVYSLYDPRGIIARLLPLLARHFKSD